MPAFLGNLIRAGAAEAGISAETLATFDSFNQEAQQFNRELQQMSVTFGALTQNMSRFLQGLTSFQGTITNIGEFFAGPFAKVQDLLGKIPIVGELAGLQYGIIAEIPRAFAAFAALAPTVIQQIGELGKALNSQFVQAYSPGEARIFNQVFVDLAATIGQQVVPVTRMIAELFRRVGDAFASAAPRMAELTDFVDKFGRQTLKDLQPLLQQGVEVFVDLMKLVVQSIASVVDALKPWLQILSEVLTTLGYSGQGGERAAGRGFVSARTTSITNVITQAQTAAFGMGISGPQERTADNTARMVEQQRRMTSVLEQVAAGLLGFGGMPGVAREAIQARETVRRGGM